MKKLITAMALVTMGTAMAADTTSTTSVADMTMGERVSGSYWANLEKATATNSDNSDDLGLYNSISMKYKLNDTYTFTVNPRFNFDNSAENRGEVNTSSKAGLDTRLALSGQKFTLSKSTTLSNTYKLEVPTTVASRDANKLALIKFYTNVTTKIDSFNTLVLDTLINKQTFTTAEASKNSVFSAYVDITYRNTKLSEKIIPSLVYGVAMLNQDAANIFDTPVSRDYARAQVSFDVIGVNLTPYISQPTAKKLAMNNSSLGLDIYKAF